MVQPQRSNSAAEAISPTAAESTNAPQNTKNDLPHPLWDFAAMYQKNKEISKLFDATAEKRIEIESLKSTLAKHQISQTSSQKELRELNALFATTEASLISLNQAHVTQCSKISSIPAYLYGVEFKGAEKIKRIEENIKWHNEVDVYLGLRLDIAKNELQKVCACLVYCRLDPNI